MNQPLFGTSYSSKNQQWLLKRTFLVEIDQFQFFALKTKDEFSNFILTDFSTVVSLTSMLPYWLASRPIKGRASALSVLQSESYLLTDQLCNNHVQHSRTLLTLTGGHLDLWPWELQPRVPSILLVSLLLILKMLNLKKWRFQGGQEMEKLSKNQSYVWSFPKENPYLMLYLVRGPCPRLKPNFSSFTKKTNYLNHKL